MKACNNTNRVDVRVPIMNGFEATRASRALSGRDTTLSRGYMNYGINAHIAKPINMGIVSHMMARYR